MVLMVGKNILVKDLVKSRADWTVNECLENLRYRGKYCQRPVVFFCPGTLLFVDWGYFTFLPHLRNFACVKDEIKSCVKQKTA